MHMTTSTFFLTLHRTEVTATFRLSVSNTHLVDFTSCFYRENDFLLIRAVQWGFCQHGQCISGKKIWKSAQFFTLSGCVINYLHFCILSLTLNSYSMVYLSSPNVPLCTKCTFLSSAQTIFMSPYLLTSSNPSLITRPSSCVSSQSQSGLQQQRPRSARQGPRVKDWWRTPRAWAKMVEGS